MSANNSDPVGGIVMWVDTKLRETDTPPAQTGSSPVVGTPLKSQGGAVEGSARGLLANAVSDSEMERRNMRLAESEQCSLDIFWGLFANKAKQAEAIAAMAMEDSRSEAVRAGIKKEERYALWEQEDLRTRDTRSALREDLEHAARREYLEMFYSALSADFAINYPWPTHAFLPQASGQQQSDLIDDEETLTMATVTDAVSNSNTQGGGSGGSGATPTLSIEQYGHQASLIDWSGDSEESLSIRPFHTFRGKKMHSMVPAQDCFVPPRHLSEPTTKYGLVSGAVLEAHLPASSGPYGNRAPRSDGWHTTAGLTKAVRLPPMTGPPRDGHPVALKSTGIERRVAGGDGFALKRSPLLKPGAPTQSLIPSFERKFAAQHAVWSREAEIEAAERALREQRRAEELLRSRQGLGSGGVGLGKGRRVRHDSGFTPLSGGERQEPADSRCLRRRRRRGWREGGENDEGRLAELIPEREELLLTEMFKMLDARNRGEVRLDEVLFHMTENAQVKHVLRQVTFWTLIKARRWEWLEELFDAQPGRKLTLSALLAFSRSLHEEKGVQRKHLRLAGGRRNGDVMRRDARSKQLLPAELVEGKEVEALFMKGFEWYRAWIVKCHPDDTFDVRFTHPSPPLEIGSPREGAAERAVEERPEVEISSQICGSEERWGDQEEEEAIATAAEEEWRSTCESVARFIGIPPDLGETEGELLERAFDAILRATTLGETRATVDNRNEAPSQTRPGGRSDEIGGSDEYNESAPPPQEGARASAGAPREEHLDGTAGNSRSRGCAATPRVPASDIIRVLRAGAIEEFRRASPALSAACIYEEFAEGLEVAAAGWGERANTANSCRIGVGGSRGDSQGEEARCGNADGGGGVSKAEFREYFEAVTDLVDLNGLSLAQECRHCHNDGPGRVRVRA